MQDDASSKPDERSIPADLDGDEADEIIATWSLLNPP
jgi:hypothetical protein